LGVGVSAGEQARTTLQALLAGFVRGFARASVIAQGDIIFGLSGIKTLLEKLRRAFK